MRINRYRLNRQTCPGIQCVPIPDLNINPFRTAVPFWGHTTAFSSSLSPKRDCGSKGVKVVTIHRRVFPHRAASSVAVFPLHPTPCTSLHIHMFTPISTHRSIDIFHWYPKYKHSMRNRKAGPGWISSTRLGALYLFQYRITNLEFQVFLLISAYHSCCSFS